MAPLPHLDDVTISLVLGTPSVLQSGAARLCFAYVAFIIDHSNGLRPNVAGDNDFTIFPPRDHRL